MLNIRVCSVLNGGISREFSTSRMVLKVYAGSSNNLYKKSNPNRGNNQHKGRPPKKSDFEFTTGSDRDKKWAKVVISSVFKSHTPKIELIKGGEIVKCGIRECFKNLDLSEQGIVIVSESDECIKLKQVKQELAMKAYSDYLAKQVTNALRASDNSVVRKQDKNNKKEDTFKGKVVQIGWGITLNDLKAQKRFEIERHLSKGFDVDVVFDDRRNLDKENVGGNVSHFKRELEEIEAIRREKVVTLLESQLEEFGAKSQREGAINGRLVISVKSIEKKGLSKEEKKAQKAAEKALRREKLATRTEKAQNI